MENTVVMIASGMKKPKKEFNPFNELNLYLNYGLLGLGTQLFEKGYQVKIFQGDYKSIDEIIEEIVFCNIDILKLQYPICISVPSFLSVFWAKDFIDKIKTINETIKVIIGGRWVIDNNLDWLKTKITNADLFIKGFGEKYIEKSICGINSLIIEENNDDVRVFDNLNYNILFNFRKYQPCIEVSRGCGRGCVFCVENKTKALPIKSPKHIIEEAIKTINLYNSDTLNFYFQASIFNPSQKWSKKFHNIYKEKNMKFKWRFETRVDSLDPNILPYLSKSGLKVIDLGLESASHKQLINMNKTKNVEVYLKKAETVLKVAYENDIWIKLNIILYPGETINTVNETLDWLNKNEKFIKGVSVNPLILYKNGDFTQPFINQIESLSKKEVNINEIEENGYSFVDLSDEIDSSYSKKISLLISRKYMNIKDYFDLKSISYYSMDTDFKNLEEIIYGNKIKDEILPFNLN